MRKNTERLIIDGQSVVDRRLYVKGYLGNFLLLIDSSNGSSRITCYGYYRKQRSILCCGGQRSTSPHSNNMEESHVSLLGRRILLVHRFKVKILNVLSKVASPENSVKVTVWDEENFGSDEVIGKIEIRVKSLMDQELHEQWYPLCTSSSKDDVSGEINLKVKFCPPSEGNSGKLYVSGIVARCYLLSFVVIQGRHLASRDSNGLSDPYVKISYGEDKRKTQVVYESLYPLWREDFEL